MPTKTKAAEKIAKLEAELQAARAYETYYRTQFMTTLKAGDPIHHLFTDAEDPTDVVRVTVRGVKLAMAGVAEVEWSTEHREILWLDDLLKQWSEQNTHVELRIAADKLRIARNTILGINT